MYRLLMAFLVSLATTLYIGGLTHPQAKLMQSEEREEVSTETEETPEDNNLDRKKMLSLLKKIDSHTVEIMTLESGGMGRCTGVVLTNGKDEATIVTAKHCIEPSEEMYVEDNLVTDIGVSVNEDLAYLKVQGHLEDKEPVVLAASNSKRNDIIFLIGYPNGDPYIKVGYVKQTSKDWQFARISVIGGCSGGGFFNEDAELVGIVWGGYKSEPTGIFEPIQDVKKFLKAKGLI